MKILLFITSINNTLDIGSEEDYEKLVSNLDKIREINEDDLIYISFCDDTPNRAVMLSYARKIADKIKDKYIYFGEQFLGDVHYKDINSSALLYSDGKLDKLSEITNYVKKLQDNGNQVELIVADGDMDINKYKKVLTKEIDSEFTLLCNDNTVKKINEFLDNLYFIKKKRLQPNQD